MVTTPSSAAHSCSCAAVEIRQSSGGDRGRSGPRGERGETTFSGASSSAARPIPPPARLPACSAALPTPNVRHDSPRIASRAHTGRSPRIASPSPTRATQPIRALCSCSTMQATTAKPSTHSSERPKRAPASPHVVIVPGPMNAAAMASPGPHKGPGSSPSPSSRVGSRRLVPPASGTLGVSSPSRTMSFMAGTITGPSRAELSGLALGLMLSGLELVSPRRCCSGLRSGLELKLSRPCDEGVRRNSIISAGRGQVGLSNSCPGCGRVRFPI